MVEAVPDYILITNSPMGSGNRDSEYGQYHGVDTLHGAADAAHRTTAPN